MTPSLKFGALSPPLAAQLADQGLVLPARDLTGFQADADALTRLYCRGYLTNAHVLRLRDRLGNSIKKAVEAARAEAGR